MCGICGALDFHGSGADEAVVRRMTDTLAHRGPDDRGVYAKAPVGLGHTRLSIIDLSPAGHQPMLSEDGSVALVYNGEVYNFRELREELVAAGHRFRGHSDSEVVLAAYEAWGEASLPRLHGMFALAVWDDRERALLLARDRFGIKPLHYTQQGGLFLFGSEIKALLAHPALSPRMSWPFLHEYLYYGNSLLARSAFEGVHKVLPGTVLRVDRNGLISRRFWDVADLPPRPEPLPQLVQGVRERLEASVRRHLVADVPVAVFLSGGIDSSAVASFAARHHEGPLRTYTAGFDQGLDVDERPQARRLAERLGTDHRELHVRVGDLRDVLEALVLAHDEPFADAANIPLYLLCAALEREGVKVVLQGDGGDEIFAGYRRYNVLAHEGLWRLAALPGIAALRVLPERPARARGLRFLRAMARRDPALRLALLLTMEDLDVPPTRVLSREAWQRVRETDPFGAYREILARFGDRDSVTRMLYTDLLLLLPDTFLAKVDRPTMAHGIEVRVPFLDAELADYVVPIPSRYKVRRLQKKYLLRLALRGIVPDEILDGPKRGLEVPYGRWLRTDLRGFVRSVLLDDATLASDLFDRAALEACIREHEEGRRDNGFLLYKLLNLALWRNAYLEPARSGLRARP